MSRGISGWCAVVLCSAVLAGGRGELRAEEARSARAEASFADVDAIVRQAIERGKMPGAVVVIGHNGRVVYRKAFGSRSIEPTREPMTVGTIFDMASLTKCIATTTAMMQLIDTGRVKLNDPVSAYLPWFGENGKGQITVRELMTHYAGLAPDLDLSKPWQGRDTALKMIMDARPVDVPGTRFVYSDINFETLGFLVEAVSGMPLNEYAEKKIFVPLGMTRTGFLPPAEWMPEIAPTEYDENGKMLRGVVHDPTARRMGGVAGHAGLFSTADDVAKFAQELLSGHAVLSRMAVEKMSTPQQAATATSLRGLGWDIDSPFASNRGELLPVGSFGHTGFTGTSLWIDPTTDTYVILLTNAVHPIGEGSVISLRTRLASAVVHSLALTVSQREKVRLARITGYNESLMGERRFTIRNGDVKAGIDVLEEHDFRELHPNREHPVWIGLVTNQTGIDAHGRRTADVLAHASGLELKAIFSPERGIAGTLDTGAIDDSRDAATGVSVYSVYGDADAKRRPKAEQLAGVDAIVYDIQDVGARFYTYETTLGYFLEAAAKAHKPIFVLDRPNPVGGTYVQGPIADAGSESFVSYGRIPVRHGMTIGELARMFNGERSIGAELTVVGMEGWMRGDWFDSTGRIWVNPSPNMRSLTEATLYTGIGMIEGSNVSVGRGTDTPFEVVGAPWIEAAALASYLNGRQIDGVRFVPVLFTPTESIYAKERCGGVNIVVTARDSLDAPELGLEIASALRVLHPKEFKIGAIDGLMRSKAALESLQKGGDPRRIAEDWQDANNTFAENRKKYLLY
ncbi:serine hydrolase [Occallatibacter savannae]|uniref:serine hydrolase n=1 Tax=Occallatibacter savannae TaxID=1002691 RepID=UPI000D689EAB|nr:serine hydrolase [Occallatibacter savannae]